MVLRTGEAVQRTLVGFGLYLLMRIPGKLIWFIMQQISINCATARSRLLDGSQTRIIEYRILVEVLYYLDFAAIPTYSTARGVIEVLERVAIGTYV